MTKMGTATALRWITVATSFMAITACSGLADVLSKPETEVPPPMPSEAERALTTAQQNSKRVDHLEQQFNAMVDDWLKYRPVIARLSDREEDLNQVIIDVANLKAAELRASSSRRATTPATSGGVTSPEEVIPGASAARKADAMTEPAKMFAVHLASYRSKQALLEGWSELKKRFPNELLELDGASQALDLGRDGVYFRLKAGPLKSKVDALEVCQIMTRSGAYCVPSDFAGDKIN